MPVNKLMLSMGVPMVLSMMLQAVYNIVDSAFVSNMAVIGEMALNALTLAFPVQMPGIIVVGIGNRRRNQCAAGKEHRAGKQCRWVVVAEMLFFWLVYYVIYFLFGCFGVKPYIASHKMSRSRWWRNNIWASAVWYPRNRILRHFENYSGNRTVYYHHRADCAVLNIILDPILIYGLFDRRSLVWVVPLMQR